MHSPPHKEGVEAAGKFGDHCSNTQRAHFVCHFVVFCFVALRQHSYTSVHARGVITPKAMPLHPFCFCRKVSDFSEGPAKGLRIPCEHPENQFGHPSAFRGAIYRLQCLPLYGLVCLCVLTKVILALASIRVYLCTHGGYHTKSDAPPFFFG